MGVQLALLMLLAAGIGQPEAGVERSEGAAGGSYVFAVVPQAPPEVMGAQWAPILERLARDAGVGLRIKLYERVEAFQAELASGAVDLAYLNPVQAIRAFQSARYQPLVRDEKPIRGVFFVERSSSVSTVAELAGREVAFVGPWSFCSVTLRKETERLGVVPRFVGTSANAYKHVILGLVPAGGILDNVLDEAPAEVREKLKVIHATPPMAAHAIVVHPRVPAEVAARIAQAVRRLAAADDGRALLRQVHMEDPVQARYARDYAPLEHLLDGPAAPGRADGRR